MAGRVFEKVGVLDDLEIAGLGRVFFVAGGKRGDTGQRAAFVKVGFLVAEVDGDARGTADAIAIPVGDLVGIVERRMRHAGRGEGFEVLRLSA